MKQPFNFFFLFAVTRLFDISEHKTNRQLVGGSVLVDDIQNRVVVGEVGLVVHSPLEGGIGAFSH